MDDPENQDQAVDLLTQLGLKEYEARSFVALSRLPQGTAKDISEISSVPRTRVYDAVDELELKGLVELQHSNPKIFRAVSIDEAVASLHSEYEDRTESLRQRLKGLEPAATAEETDVTHEVWALSGETAILNRIQQLIAEADREIVLVIGDAGIFTESLIDSLHAAEERGVDVIIGTITEELRDQVATALPDTEVFVSGLEWLSHSTLPDDTTEISRLILVDNETILVSTYSAPPGESRAHEQAVFGRGFDNGLVTIVRRLMATGLISGRESGP